MRFGTFVFSMSSDPREDHQVIDNTMREVELAEGLGFDAVWLTEHHFDGAVAYADPVIFAAAVAMRTHRMRIGFAVVEMANIGRPVLIGAQPLETLCHRLQLYRDTMLAAGFEEPAVEKALDETWVQKGLYVADGDDEAVEVATQALRRYRSHLDESRRKYNPSGLPPRKPGQPPPAGEVVEHAFVAGSPGTVAQQIAALRDVGVRNLLLNVNVGQMPSEQVERSMRLFGEKVLPAFRSH
jgi:alkanesulfonate monooxygenase SsuD/methylene tetrahydromethanopterin reductase-like flavin-dependent oxidoreductase (luciferase family)